MNKLRKNFDKAVKAYLDELHKQFDWDEYNGYWVGDDNTGVYAYGDNYFLTLSDIIYIVDNEIPIEEIDEWSEYVLWASEFNQTVPNLPSWHKGCPRYTKEQRAHLEKARQDFWNEIENLRDMF